MANLARFGVSLREDLLLPFDELCRRKSYTNRSEAIRDLIRRALIQDEWKRLEGEVAGTLTLVYDHHSNDLARRLMDIQHDHYNVVITSMHVHLDHHNCLEVLVLRGDAAAVSSLADRLIACNGVKHGVFVPTTLGKDLA